MSFAPTLTKQAAEVRTVTFDFTDKLLSGDSVSALSTIEAATGITCSAGTLLSNAVTTLVSSGTAGNTYRISCRVTTTLGETLELDVNLVVADGQN